jgi:hypothetical protein
MAAPMVYQWRGGEYAGDHQLANAVGAALERIRLEAGGVLAAQDIVVAARAEESPLHRFFNWDDRSAARAWRLDQAKDLVKALVVVIPDADGPSPAYEATIAKHVNGPVFTRLTPRVFMPAPQPPRFARLQQALRALEDVRKRYADLQELEAVMSAIDEHLAYVAERALAQAD